MVDHGNYKNYRSRLRLKALEKIAGTIGISCVNCGCDDVRTLEINHRNGGGRKEEFRLRNKATTAFYKQIITGDRKVDDLEITCRVCNAFHYLQFKYGPLPFTITWTGNS